MNRFSIAVFCLILAALGALAQEPLPLPRVTGFTVFDATLQQDVGPLEEGGSVCWERRFVNTTNRTVKVAVEGVATSVQVRLDNVTAETIGQTFHDMAEPWTLCGDYERQDGQGAHLYGCRAFAMEGSATLAATPYDGSRAGTGLTISLTVVPGCSQEPEGGALDSPSDPQPTRRTGGSGGSASGTCYFAGSGASGNGLEQGLSWGDRIPCPGRFGADARQGSHPGYIVAGGTLQKGTAAVTEVCGNGTCASQWVIRVP